MDKRIINIGVLVVLFVSTIVQLISVVGANTPFWIQSLSLLFLVVGLAYFLLLRPIFGQASTSFARKSLQDMPNKDVGEGAYKYTAKRYGVGYQSIDVQWTISVDGSAKVQRIISVEAFSEISSLDTFLLVPERATTEDGDIIGFESISSMTPGRTATLKDEIEESGRQSTLITISGPMNVGDSMTYKMIENLPQGLYAINVTVDEVKKRKKPYDYAGWTINRPTKHITLRVFFPEGIEAPQIYSTEVLYSSASGFPSTRIQHEEQKKMKPTILGPEGGRYILKLEVEHPMIGLIYILRWQPDSFPVANS